ncbi:MAG TPA: hypothetical protein VGO78_00250 [Acidimicrobiales bacterium]|jgi:hypothetical protein|nr:hypothetical protein [Acidimicrobiales bacterium]
MSLGDASHAPTADVPTAPPDVDPDVDPWDVADPVDEVPGNGAHTDVDDDLDTDQVLSWDDERWSTEPPDAEPGPYDRMLRIGTDVLVVAACALFVFLQLGPHNIFSDTTPAGGDMGAHVWGPAYLRDHLLPHWQLAGWAPDWYAGFPAYQFYMVVPSLAIVALDLGFQGPWVVLPILALGVALVVAGRSWYDSPRRRNLALAAVPLALLCIGLPYGVAFKLVSVSGAVTLPIAAYLFGRLAGLKFPTPAVLAVGTLPFLFYRGFTIYGGNLASTLAGEFAFSISLSIGLVYLGVVFRGLETGKHRALAAGLLALTGLCHLIPAFWVISATVLIAIVRPRHTRTTLVVPAAVVASGGVALGLLWWLTDIHAVGLASAAAIFLAMALWLVFSQSLAWLIPVGAVGGLLSSFWVVPFALRHTYVNDMGWEKLPYFGQEGEGWGKYLFPKATPDVDLRWVFGLAMVGLGLSLAMRLRVGIFLGLVTTATGFAFWLMPAGRLWNGRLLPFYYLSVMLLAALAVAEALRLVVELSNPRQRAGVTSGVSTALGALAATLLFVGLPLGVVPMDEKLDAAEGGSTGYAWPSFSPFQLHATPESFIKGWANWNFSGYERKDSYREYYDVVQTMNRLGQDGGCGRAFWEYEKELDRYGTPMALMLLPYWTDGCIGSMEGLYFEASTTTPFHFLMQTELSTAPSAAQRDMPYGGFDITKGVQHLQMMGVRYYMATSDQAVQAADTNPDLTKVASSGPWEIYEVADAPLVQGLANEPLVLEGVEPDQQGWLKGERDDAGRFNGPSIQWFQNPARWDVQWSLGGPDEWQHVQWNDLEEDIARGDLPEARPVAPVEVSHVKAGNESIAFDVDRVGSPVLVKTSYFPNWKASGAEGPWRVAPNLMVVVPTEKHVVMTYGSTPVEWLGYGLTFVGLAALLLLARRGMFRFRETPEDAAVSTETADAEGAAPDPPPA